VSGDSPKRWRIVSSTACSAALLVAAGCGGSTQQAQPSQLPASLGRSLTDRTAKITAELGSGDPASAHRDALALRAAVVAAIDAGRVPTSLQEPLLAGANRLLAAIELPPPAPAKTKKHEHKGKHHGDEHGD